MPKPLTPTQTYRGFNIRSHKGLYIISIDGKDVQPKTTISEARGWIDNQCENPLSERKQTPTQTLAHKRKLKAEQMARYREKFKITLGDRTEARPVIKGAMETASDAELLDIYRITVAACFKRGFDGDQMMKLFLDAERSAS